MSGRNRPDKSSKVLTLVRIPERQVLRSVARSPPLQRVIKVELSLEALFASGCKRWPKLSLQFTQIYFKEASSGDRERLTQSPKSDASREVGGSKRERRVDRDTDQHNIGE